MNVISRKTAKEQGLKRYFTGKPCRYGHASERYSCSGTCILCEKNWAQNNLEKIKVKDSIRGKIYRDNNSEKIRLKNKFYRESNQEKIKLMIEFWSQVNLEKIKINRKIWRQNNLEKIKLKDKLWNQANSDKKNATSAKRRAMKLKSTPSWTNFKYIELFYSMSKEAESETGKKYNVDHIIPLKSKYVCGFHTEDNLQVLESTKNISKGNRIWPDMPVIDKELKQLAREFYGIN